MDTKDPISKITGELQRSFTSLTISCCHALSWVLTAVKTTQYQLTVSSGALFQWCKYC
jgi:hypothetical protein